MFEFSVSPENYKLWAESKGLSVRSLIKTESVSRYRAYLPEPPDEQGKTLGDSADISEEAFRAWQEQIAKSLSEGLIAKGPDGKRSLYDLKTKRAYYEYLTGF